ncbi:biotin/lipoyl-containing protein [Candidatus Avelusimicrobium caledoniensis]|uniref:biotin/lipoyl-containing protein n=1 Tax=Candidatus Avelusimicrobium caledoniensis TaxID=3416220 RepID=UPI003D0A8153
MKKINFMLTAFRDGFQSVYGARVLTKDFMPAVEAARHAGISHMEFGGGARFQALFFYCNENAFDMMDTFRKTAGPDANLQTLARGVNVVGLDSQSSDVIKAHAELFKKHGTTTIRNFDALNDVNNLIYSGQCIHNAGLKHEICVTMMSLAPGWDPTGKIHTAVFYEKVLKDILKSGVPFDSVCFKDASGTSTPHTVGETIAMARRVLPAGTKIVFHTHETAGNSIACCLEAIKAGADSLDLSMQPVSGGTCQPDILTMWHALRGTEYTLDIDPKKIQEAENVFQDCMRKYFLPPEATKVNPIIPFSPLPGGALTANTQMMRDNGTFDKFPEVVKAMGECVKLGGFGTSVTPVSQFYFQQAYANVMFGPWKKITEGYGKMVLGYFGKTPVKADPEIVKIASEQLKREPTTKTPLEINDADPKKGLKVAEAKLKEAGLPVNEENAFIVATCADKGLMYLKGEAKINGIRWAADVKPATKQDGPVSVTVEGKTYTVSFENDTTAVVNGKRYNVGVGASAPAQTAAKPAAGAGATVNAPVPGAVLRFSVKEGEHVAEGQEILVMEAMKMETPVAAPAAGTVHFVVKQGDQIQTGHALAEIK